MNKKRLRQAEHSLSKPYFYLYNYKLYFLSMPTAIKTYLKVSVFHVTTSRLRTMIKQHSPDSNTMFLPHLLSFAKLYHILAHYVLYIKHIFYLEQAYSVSLDHSPNDLQP